MSNFVKKNYYAKKVIELAATKEENKNISNCQCQCAR